MQEHLWVRVCSTNTPQFRILSFPLKAVISHFLLLTRWFKPAVFHTTLWSQTWIHSLSVLDSFLATSRPSSSSSPQICAHSTDGETVPEPGLQREWALLLRQVSRSAKQRPSLWSWKSSVTREISLLFLSVLSTYCIGSSAIFTYINSFNLNKTVWQYYFWGKGLTCLGDRTGFEF